MGGYHRGAAGEGLHAHAVRMFGWLEVPAVLHELIESKL